MWIVFLVTTGTTMALPHNSTDGLRLEYSQDAVTMNKMDQTWQTFLDTPPPRAVELAVNLSELH